MTEKSLLFLMERYWPETIDLLRNLIRAHPTYENVGGLEQASLLISSFLERSGISPIEICYKNEEFHDHSLYVRTEDFGTMFSDDKYRRKKNIIAIIDSGKPGSTLILNGHYDVDCVSTPEQWYESQGWSSAKIDGDYLYGRGASDMLGGLCVLLLIMRILQEKKDEWRGRVVITAVCDEEIGGNGTLKTLLWLEKNGILEGEISALIAEPSGRLICRESLGFFHIKLEATRKSMHMGVAQKENNALHDVIQIVKDFPALIEKVCEDMSRLTEQDKIIFNWGIISGGRDAAIPLGHVHLEGAIFLPEALDSQGFQERLLREILLTSGGVVKIEFSSFNFPGALSDTGFIYQNFFLEKVLPTEHQVFPDIFPSPCDARLFKSFGIPVIVYGPGSLAQAHAVDEYISLKELEDYAAHCMESVWRSMHD